MYRIGFLFYIAIVFSYFYIDEIYEVINQSYILAQAITIVMGILYLYPLLIFTYICIFSKKTEKHKHIIDSQTKIAASVSVSVGLIGTFQGLTAMVSSIAQSMGGDGDMTEKMNSMLSAISSALSAMSYAFLTSILGVAVSVLLLLSLNFWLFYFKDKNTKPKKERNLNVNYKNVVIDNFGGIEDKLNSLNEKMDSQISIQRQDLDSKNELISSLKDISGSLHTIKDQLSEKSKFEKEQIVELNQRFEQLKNRLKHVMEIMLK